MFVSLEIDKSNLVNCLLALTNDTSADVFLSHAQLIMTRITYADGALQTGPQGRAHASDRVRHFTGDWRVYSGQQQIYKDFLDAIYTLDKDGKLNDLAASCAFANAHYQASTTWS